MRLLIDTNIFLEIILDQDKAEDAKALIGSVGDHDFFISDYSLHSIGILLFRRKQHDIFRLLLSDIIQNAGMTVASIPAEDLQLVADVALRFNLDFDDAYQYAIAEKFNLTIVSFDSDFNRTERGRKTPAEVLSA